MRYHKVEDRELIGKEEGAAMLWRDGVILYCPCGERTVYVASPPHTEISFGDGGLLTIAPSIGYKKQEKLKREKNWCHLFIKNGIF